MSISSLSAPSPPRSLSRPSSRGSFRSTRTPSPGPSLLPDDPVAVRTHISTLKHNIRQQQAQLHTLENVVLRGPRPYPPGIMSSHSPSSSTVDLSGESTAPSSFSHGQPSTPTKLQRRSSFDRLHNIAPDSSLPLPKRENMRAEGSIREGVPMEFGVSDAKSGHHKRVSSPTRTYSRIPVSSVGNARALADEGTSSPSPPTNHNRTSLAPAPIDVSSSNSIASNGSSTLPPASPNKRQSLTPGGTTKVLADLQAGVINARHALDNTKAQLRVSQRSVAQLTRQTEDLKEGRERLRLENEGLNNVVARKERLLQEVLERARKAEAEAALLKAQLKSETTTSKKSIRDMEHALTESTALSQKSEREYITLRESLKSMAESWKHDADRLRDEMTKREDKLKAEAEIMGKKYKRLLHELGRDDNKDSVKSLRAEDEKIRKQIEDAFRDEIATLRQKMDRVSGDGEEANQTAKSLATELGRLRRMMQAAGRDSVQL